MQILCIIVCYNGEKWIHSCLDHLLNSTVKVKIAVIDNASSDNSVSIIRQYFPEVILVENERNLGFGAANNIGLRMALETGVDYAVLVNQDAYAEPETIEKLVLASQSNRSAGILSPIHLNGKGDSLDSKFSSNLFSIRNFVYDLVKGKYKQGAYDISFVNAAFWMITRDTIMNVGGFDPMFFHYGEDANYCQRVLFHGYRILVVPDTFIRHDRAEKLGSRKEFFTGDLLQDNLMFMKINYGDVSKSLSPGCERTEKIKSLKECFVNMARFDPITASSFLRRYFLIERTFAEIKKSREITSGKAPAYIK